MIMSIQSLETKLRGCIEQRYMSIEAEMELSDLSEQSNEINQDTVYDDIMQPLYGKNIEYENTELFLHCLIFFVRIFFLM